MKIRDRATGKIIEIQDSEASSYGLGATSSATIPAGNTGEFNISPQQAMLAQILMPGKGADMVKSAYDIQRQSEADNEKQQEKIKKDQESKAALKGFVDVAGDLKQGTKDISVLNALPMKISGLFGNETPLKQFDRKKALVGQYLAKLVEKGRLSDADRKFYQDQIFNIGPYGEQAGKEEALDSVIRDVVRLSGEDPESLGLGVDGKKKIDQTQGSQTYDSTITNPQTPNQTEGKSLKEFGSNAIADLMNMVRGVGTMAKYQPAIILSDLMRGDTSSIEQYPDLVKGLPRAVIEPYYNLATKPVETAYEQPITTATSLIPFLNALKSLKAASSASTATSGVTSIADDVARVTPKTGITSIVDDVGSQAPKLDPSIERIIDKAGKAGETSGVSQMARNVYQSVLNFSKKNKAFERLKPNDTVATMIEDGITGTPDQIITKMNTVTGKNGVLSNVVNEAIADTNIPANVDDIGNVYSIVNDSKKGVYSELRPEDFDSVTEQLNDLPQLEGQAPGTYDLSRLLDYERKLQAEAQSHRINGMSGDVRSKELGQFKTSVAEEIGGIIDSKVKKVGSIDKYKDPAIIAELERVSPKLAEKYKNAKTISEIRSLQRDYVRMGMIMDLVMQEPSSLGRNLFRAGAQIPVIGPILDTIAQQAAVPLATKSAVGIQNFSNNPYLKKLIR